LDTKPRIPQTPEPEPDDLSFDTLYEAYGGRGGGGRGGGGGGQPSGDFERPEPVDVWVTVQLAKP